MIVNVLLFDAFDPNRESSPAVRAAVAAHTAQRKPDADRSTDGLPDLDRSGGRMSVAQLQAARRGWGGAYFKHVEAEHGEGRADD